MSVSRPAVTAVSLLAVLFAALLAYYRPTLEYDPNEPIAWLVFALVLPVAISAVLAYTPALRHNSWKAGAVCLSVGLVDAVLSLAFSSDPTIDEMTFAVVAGFIPMLALFAVSRLSTCKRVPWTLLVIGPLAYWVTALCAVLVWIVALHNANP